MLTVEVLTGQIPLLMLHWKTLVPVPSAVTPLVGLLGVVMVPKPDSSVQLPSPIPGVLPEKFVDVVAHKLKLVPALATVGLAKLVMLTVEVLGGHTPLLMVHWKMFVPVPKAVTPLAGFVGVVIVPKPDTKLQLPVPIAGVLPDKFVAVVAHKLKLLPALATLGLKKRVTDTVEVLGGHTPLLMVHANTLVPTPKKFTAEVGEFADATIPLPDTKLHVPVPTSGVLPARFVLVIAQILKLTPAFDGVGVLNCVTSTVDTDTGQTPLLMLHSNTFDPMPKPTTAVVGEVGTPINPEPASRFHTPIPTVGVLPVNVVEDVHKVCVGPALATVGKSSRCIKTVELFDVHTPLSIVQANTFIPAPSEVILLLGEFGFVMVPKPDTNVHVPVPTAGVLPANTVEVAQMV
jgi:hypothetical protein